MQKTARGATSRSGAAQGKALLGSKLRLKGPLLRGAEAALAAAR